MTTPDQTTITGAISALIASGLAGSMLTLIVTGRRERRNWLRDKKFAVYTKVLDAVNRWTEAAVDYDTGHDEWPESFTSLHSQAQLLIHNEKLEEALRDFHSWTDSLKINLDRLSEDRLREHRSQIITHAYRVEHLLKNDLLHLRRRSPFA